MATTDKLTDTAIRGAKSRAKAYKLFDGGGLYVLVRPDGRRYWRFKYYVDGVEKLISFGVYPKVTLAMARKRRQATRESIELVLIPASSCSKAAPPDAMPHRGVLSRFPCVAAEARVKGCRTGSRYCADLASAMALAQVRGDRT